MTKNNEKLKKWSLIFGILGVIILLILEIVSSVYGYGRLSERVDETRKELIDVDAASLVHEVRLDDHDKLIIGIEKDVTYIKKAVDRIENKLDND